MGSNHFSMPLTYETTKTFTKPDTHTTLTTHLHVMCSISKKRDNKKKGAYKHTRKKKKKNRKQKENEKEKNKMQSRLFKFPFYWPCLICMHGFKCVCVPMYVCDVNCFQRKCSVTVKIVESFCKYLNKQIKCKQKYQKCVCVCLFFN